MQYFKKYSRAHIVFQSAARAGAAVDLSHESWTFSNGFLKLVLGAFSFGLEDKLFVRGSGYSIVEPVSEVYTGMTRKIDRKSV